MTPQLVAFYEGAAYARMARVCAHTAALHCPDWDRRIVATTLFYEGQRTVEQRVRQDNQKLLRWTEAVEAAADHTPMLLIDVDVMILRSLDEVWTRSFDVAYTKRDPTRTPLPLNAGVVFVRATDPARRFLRAWYQATVPIRKSPRLQEDARRRFGACDQAGLAATLKSPAVTGVQVLALPCQEWNCEDSEWARFDARTRIVHIKGALRDAIFGRPITKGRQAMVKPLAQQWRAAEQEIAA